MPSSTPLYFTIFASYPHMQIGLVNRLLAASDNRLARQRRAEVAEIADAKRVRNRRVEFGACRVGFHLRQRQQTLAARGQSDNLIESRRQACDLRIRPKQSKSKTGNFCRRRLTVMSKFSRRAVRSRQMRNQPKSRACCSTTKSIAFKRAIRFQREGESANGNAPLAPVAATSDANASHRVKTKTFVLNTMRPPLAEIILRPRSSRPGKGIRTETMRRLPAMSGDVFLGNSLPAACDEPG